WCLGSFSWALLKETRGIAGIVIHRPGVGKRAVRFSKEQPPAGERGQFGAQRRETAGNEVGIHEMNDPGVLGQKFAGERCLARAVRRGNDNAARGADRSASHLSQVILISFSSALNSGSPVTNSTFLIFASAAPKQSA